MIKSGDSFFRSNCLVCPKLSSMLLFNRLFFVNWQSCRNLEIVLIFTNSRQDSTIGNTLSKLFFLKLIICGNLFTRFVFVNFICSNCQIFITFCCATQVNAKNFFLLCMIKKNDYSNYFCKLTHQLISFVQQKTFLLNCVGIYSSNLSTSYLFPRALSIQTHTRVTDLATMK